MRCNEPGDVVGTAQYGQQVTAIIARDNIAATQFHPEKSQDSGIELVGNFLRWNLGTPPTAMLKKRLIPKFLLRDGRLVKYVRFFENERAAGNPVTTAKIYNDYGVDELIVLDIVPSAASRGRVVEIIERMSEEIFMPFTVGGGVKTLDDVNMLCAPVPTRYRSIRKPCGVRSSCARRRAPSATSA